ncbi:hypothetical protein AKG30_00215 [Lacticaseibacillus paracasei]|nr:hypothetical protein AKG30_00215 [Lacticaseibacillus paracasei]
MQTTQRPGLELMLLGDFEAGFWARSAVSALAPHRQPHLAENCGVWHGKGFFSLNLSQIIRNLMNHQSSTGIMTHPFSERWIFLVPLNPLITLNELANKALLQTPVPKCIKI